MGGVQRWSVMVRRACSVCASVRYVCVFVGQTVGIIGLTAPTVKGVTESTGVCS